MIARKQGDEESAFLLFVVVLRCLANALNPLPYCLLLDLIDHYEWKQIET